MVPISGFTIVRNGVRLAFPIEAAIRSLLPVCEEVVVNVGRSDDGTLDLIRSIDNPRIRVLETDWDMTIRDKVLSDETLRAMRACRHPWGIYIQADEVLHELGANALGEGIQRWDADLRVEGLLVDYLHFYGGFDTVMANRRWYRHEVRAVRLNPALDIHPFRDAQGFRVGPEDRKVRAKLTGARMFHYGWARPAHALHAKRALDSEIWQWSEEKKQRQVPLLGWAPGLRAYRGDHPAAAAEYVARWREDPARRVAPPVFRWRFLRYWISDFIERVTGIRVFEYRNYRVV